MNVALTVLRSVLIAVAVVIASYATGTTAAIGAGITVFAIVVITQHLAGSDR